MNHLELKTERSAPQPAGFEELACPERAARFEVLIQDATSGKYYAEHKGWVTKMDLAHDFKNVPNAVSRAVRSRLGAVDILMHFGNSQFDVRLPVNCRQ